MSSNNQRSVKGQANGDGVVEEIIKYKIRKNGSCNLKLHFVTAIGKFYKDVNINTFNGSLLETSGVLIKKFSTNTIEVDGILNEELNVYEAKKYLLFHSAIVAASLEYMEILDYKNSELDADVKLCLVNSLINSTNAKILYEPVALDILVNAVTSLTSLDYSVDVKNVLNTLDFISNNIKHYVCKDSEAVTHSLSSNIRGKRGVSSTLIFLESLLAKYEKLDNNDLVMAMYRIIKCVKHKVT